MASTAFDYKVWRQRPVLLHLESVFRRVCAYCECSYVSGYPAVEHYRPKSKLKDDPDGHQGYYWLAYTDRNYRLACTPCNTNKSSKFPVAGKRAITPADSLDGEDPLLLDPCETADPDAHLLFDERGNTTGLTEAGRRTITELKLNRDDLKRERLDAWRYFRDSINLAILASDPKRVTLPAAPTYLGVRRAVVREMRRVSVSPQFFEQLLDLLNQL